ncbi:hypothetical protein C8Q75DRAFT_785859 [Abortiporus biennis]|nr:hypothetical protein C8Q75DRAFT_785859 [Abortiporus biennis]
MTLATLPQELIDHIIGEFHHHNSTLSSCSLVSRSWLAPSRYHLFSRLSIRYLGAQSGHSFRNFFLFIATLNSDSFHDTTILWSIRDLTIWNDIPELTSTSSNASESMFVFCTDMVSMILSKLSRLHHLTLSHVEIIAKCECRFSQARRIEEPSHFQYSLESLTLDNVRSGSRYSRGRGIQQHPLTYEEHSNLTMNDILQLLSLFSSIKTLSLDSFESFQAGEFVLPSSSPSFRLLTKSLLGESALNGLKITELRIFGWHRLIPFIFGSPSGLQGIESLFVRPQFRTVIEELGKYLMDVKDSLRQLSIQITEPVYQMSSSPSRYIVREFLQPTLSKCLLLESFELSLSMSNMLWLNRDPKSIITEHLRQLSDVSLQFFSSLPGYSDISQPISEQSTSTSTSTQSAAFSPSSCRISFTLYLGYQRFISIYQFARIWDWEGLENLLLGQTMPSSSGRPTVDSQRYLTSFQIKIERQAGSDDSNSSSLSRRLSSGSNKEEEAQLTPLDEREAMKAIICRNLPNLEASGLLRVWPFGSPAVG